MKVNAICYKTKVPVVYNNGTVYERTCDEFLAYQTCKNDEEALAEVEKLNTEKPERLWNGKKIDWNEIDHFFVNKQEEM